MKPFKNMKIGESDEITFDEAKLMLTNTEHERNFKLLNESTINNFDDNIGFEVCRNRTYDITKVGRAGAVLYKGSEHEIKSIIGIFEISMKYDYMHPNNFAQNKYNVVQKFKVSW